MILLKVDAYQRSFALATTFHSHPEAESTDQVIKSKLILKVAMKYFQPRLEIMQRLLALSFLVSIAGGDLCS